MSRFSGACSGRRPREVRFSLADPGRLVWRPGRGHVGRSWAAGGAFLFDGGRAAARRVLYCLRSLLRGFRQIPRAASLATSAISCCSGCALSLTATAACCSFSLAGISAATTSPAPKATSPAARGFALAPACVQRHGAELRDLGRRRHGRLRGVADGRGASWAEPITRSRSPVIAPLTLPTWRLAIVLGFAS